MAPMPSISMRTTSPARSQRGGLKPMPTPAGVPVAMMSPGSSVMPREQVSIKRRDVEDHVARRRVLAQLGLGAGRRDPAAHARVARIELVGGHDPRPHRAEGVAVLAEHPLLVAHLHVARADVVEHGVAADMVHRPRARDVAPTAADHHRQFALVVDLLGHRLARQPHHVVRADHGLGELGEHHRPLVFLGQAVAEHAARQLLCMRVVVAPDAEDVAPRARDRRTQGDRIHRHARPVGRGQRLALGQRFDQPQRGAAGVVDEQGRGLAAVGRHDAHMVTATPAPAGDAHAARLRGVSAVGRICCSASPQDRIEKLFNPDEK